MKYLLRKAVWSDVPEIEISAEEYAEFEMARSILSNALAIEEKYEIVLTNYIEFEKQILETTTSTMVRTDVGYSDFFELRLGLNVCLVNMLTAVRLYRDQLTQHVRDCLPNSVDARQKVKNLLTHTGEESEAYRFMEQLRNYVQHRGLPIHWTQAGSRWTSLDENASMEFSLELAARRADLEEDSRFDETVLSELDDKIDLKAATRSYMESISNVHQSIRDLIAESVNSSRKLIDDAHRRYSAVYDGSTFLLAASKWSDDERDAYIPLFLEWDNVRVKLQQRNRKLVNLSKRYVTSRVAANPK